MRLILFLVSFVLAASMSWAEPTTIAVHVQAKGAKFVGTSMGGALVTLEDALTGELLAKGYTAGSTGDTELIMKDKHTTHTPVTTDDAAGFTATLELEEPTLVRVAAQGPMTQMDGAAASATMWVVPGRHVTGGDGWKLELPGLAVDVLSPSNHVKLSGPQTVHITANVTLQCGCGIKPGGLWDSEPMEITAVVLHEGEVVAENAMSYAGTTSHFETRAELQDPGVYEIRVIAHDPRDGNTGLGRATCIIEQP